MTDTNDDIQPDLYIQLDAQSLRHAREEFFSRPLSEDYTHIWSELLSRNKQDTNADETSSVVIFRIGNRWLALPSQTIKSIADVHTPHRIPHHAGAMRGIANIDGELTLCFSLDFLIKHEEEPPESTVPQNAKKPSPRMLVIGFEKQTWGFTADEVLGVFNISAQKLQKTPVTVSKSPTKLTQHVFECKGLRVGLIDEELLVRAMERSLK
ncbi:MAG TPA: chemotaxis protein CheW [Phycisphaerae bacterium]|nr:chemotaxis protein CheW [Phycisphaerae bacterium]